MRLVIVGLLLLLTVNTTLQECHEESIFRKLGNDIKLGAEKFAHDVKRGAEGVSKNFGADVKYVANKLGDEVKDAAAGSGNILKKLGVDVEKVFKVFRHDISVAWVKSKPYMKEAFVYIDGVMKRLDNVEETSGLTDVLKDSEEKLKQ